MSREPTERLTATQAFEYNALLRRHGDICRCADCNHARAQLIAREPETDGEEPDKLAE